MKTAELLTTQTSIDKGKEKKRKGGNCNGFAARVRKAEVRTPLMKTMPLVGLMNDDGTVVNSSAQDRRFAWNGLGTGRL